jgi:SagB-type dehydrogenase family enzyme
MTLAASEYHRKTSYDRNDMKGHGLDWANQPTVFKSYPGLDTVSLAEPEEPLPDVFLSELVKRKSVREVGAAVSFPQLSRIIGLAHRVTAKARHGAGYFYYRNVASAGALYPFELYVGAKAVSGLDDGLYHHTLGLGALTRLRAGDMTAALADGLQTNEGLSWTAAFFLTSIFFRSAWKYRDRAYRYHLLDTGHLAESLLLALVACGLSARWCVDFDDDKINALLGVDPTKEVCLGAAVIEGKELPSQTNPQVLSVSVSGSADASRVSPHEVDFILIRQAHAASSAVVRASRPPVGGMLQHLGLNMKQRIDLPSGRFRPEKMSYVEAVSARRSKRNFVSQAIPSEAFHGLVELLSATTFPGRGDVCWTAREVLSVGLLCGNVQGFDPGFYVLDPEGKALCLAAEGFMNDKMARICLDQAWLAYSALHVVFLSNTEVLENCWGPRGYRYAMLNAGRLGQRFYLGATSMGLGCCGIGAFFDDEAGQLLGTNQATRLLYLVAVGPVKR